jgi:hypothetical protein
VCLFFVIAVSSFDPSLLPVAQVRGRVGWKVPKPKLTSAQSADGTADPEHSKLLLHYFECVSEFSFGKHPDVSCIGIQTWLALLKNFSFLPRTQCPLMAAKLWELLHLRYAHTHFRVASFLYALQKLSNCEHVIAEAVLHPRAADYVEGYRYVLCSSAAAGIECLLWG